VGGFNTGWWPLIWFVTKVWTFLFLFMWLRATLPRMRYDQFMALGWKLLIPVSLVWIMIVALLRSAHLEGVVPGLIAAAVLLVVLVAVTSLRRKAKASRTVPEPPPLDADAFPVPPLPGSSAPTARSRDRIEGTHSRQRIDEPKEKSRA
jgi:NADH-quinone oxidoreductase subunit H